jgi:hypothetical protein
MEINMKHEQFAQMFENAGFDQLMLNYLGENQHILRLLAQTAKSIRAAQIRAMLDAYRGNGNAYCGKMDESKIPDAIATLRLTGKPFQQTDIAKELGCTVGTLGMAMTKYPYIRAIYVAAMAGVI